MTITNTTKTALLKNLSIARKALATAKETKDQKAAKKARRQIRQINAALLKLGVAPKAPKVTAKAAPKKATPKAKKTNLPEGTVIAEVLPTTPEVIAEA